jgi:hypothetical protein
LFTLNVARVFRSTHFCRNSFSSKDWGWPDDPNKVLSRASLLKFDRNHFLPFAQPALVIREVMPDKINLYALFIRWSLALSSAFETQISLVPSFRKKSRWGIMVPSIFHPLAGGASS